MIRNRPTPPGAVLGRELARMVDEAEPRARLVEPLIPPRCTSCAFRAGPHVANGSPQTLVDAMACVFDHTTFECHEPARAGQPCSGWLMLQLADAADRGEGRHDLPLGSTTGRYGHDDHTPVCVSHTGRGYSVPSPHLETRPAKGYTGQGTPSGVTAEGLPAIQAPLCGKGLKNLDPLRTKGLAEAETLPRPEGVQRTRSGADLAAVTTEPALEYARRDARPLDARSTP